MPNEISGHVITAIKLCSQIDGYQSHFLTPLLTWNWIDGEPNIARLKVNFGCSVLMSSYSGMT